MRDMLQAGVHFGHQTRFWNPKMRDYIFGSRSKIHIIDLEKTLPMFLTAVEFVRNIASKGGKVLFVGTKRSAQELVRDAAIRCGMPYIDHRWLGGMLTNYKTVRQSIRRLKDLEARVADVKTMATLTKKETLTLERELEKLERSLGGIKNMGSLPDVIFVVDVGYESTAVTEANKLKIPVIGIVDTNNSPDGIDFVVPGNDDAIRAISLYSNVLADTIIAAREEARLAVGEDEFVELETAEGKAPKAKKEKAKPKDKSEVKVATKAKKAADTAEEAPAAESAPESDADASTDKE
jgi:small subunit ribosomal protein S2